MQANLQTKCLRRINMRQKKNVVLNTTVLNLKRNVLIPMVLASGFSMSALANDQYSDLGRVISVSPQTERINVPRQECRTEYQQQSYQNNRSITGAVIGGIAGGLLGNTVGRGSGRVAAAAVGAGVGAIAGDRIGNQNNGVTTRSVPVQTCYQVDNWQSVNAGYLVTYQYNGRTYSTITNNYPGQYIDVNVAVAPQHQSITNITYHESQYTTPRYYDNNYRDNDHRGHGNKHGWNNHGKHKHDRDDHRRWQ